MILKQNSQNLLPAKYTHHTVAKSYHDYMTNFCLGKCVNGSVRLKGSGNPTYGRVEVCVNELWGTVCGQYWDYKDASVLCNQLGYSPYG